MSELDKQPFGLNNDLDYSFQELNSISGADIRMMLAGVEIAEIQQIGWGIAREKAPNFVLGDETCKSYSRGKRHIAGTLMLAMFRREALLEGMSRARAKTIDPDFGTRNFWGWKDRGTIYDHSGQEAAGISPLDGTLTNSSAQSELRQQTPVSYADQILPFNITITANTEAGLSAVMSILHVEILNTQHGFSIDTLQADHQYTWVARHIKPWRRLR